MSKVALYRHYDKNDALLYVGISLSSIARMVQHKQKADWTGDAVKMTTEWLDSREEALEAEKIAIKEESPLYNIVHNRPPKFNHKRHMVKNKETGEIITIRDFINIVHLYNFENINNQFGLSDEILEWAK